MIHSLDLIGSPNQRLNIDWLRRPKKCKRQRHSERYQCVDAACRFGLVELAAAGRIVAPVEIDGTVLGLLIRTAMVARAGQAPNARAKSAAPSAGRSPTPRRGRKRIRGSARRPACGDAPSPSWSQAAAKTAGPHAELPLRLCHRRARRARCARRLQALSRIGRDRSALGEQLRTGLCA